MAWCREWTQRVDSELRDLLGPQRGVAVIALGGYARRELCPASDVDLLLLHDGWQRTGLEALVERLCYPLWDARLQVGHAVRTPAEAVRDAGERIDAATAVLDRRLVAGDRGLFDALSSRVQRWSRRRGSSYLAMLAAADAERRRAGDSHPGMLEPDLKNGAGALRDIHSLRWAAGWMLGEVGLDPLVAAGYLGADDRGRLGAANTTLLRVRTALHLTAPTAAGAQADVLRLERQDEVADILGAGDADALLREVGLAARTVSHLHDRTWRLLLTDRSGGRRRRRGSGQRVADDLRVVDGLVAVDDDASLVDDPSLGWRAVAAAARHGAQLDRPAATRLADDAARLRTLPWTNAAVDALLELLRAGDNAADGLAEADHVGLLAAHLPEWQQVRGRPQRNPLHRFDLDTHGARAVVALHRLRRDESLDLLWQRVPDTDALLLATWLHDVGKAWPGDHSEAGAEVVTRWLSAMGVGPDRVRFAATLVRHHLLLPDVATRRDLDDPTEIRAVAGAVGDGGTLDALYLLSLADAQATGPAAWSRWKGALMATLHARTSALLAGNDPSAEDPVAAARLAGAADDALETLRAQAPPRYFQIADGAQVAAHARLIDALSRQDAAGVDVRRGSVEGTSVVSVVARDRPGLLADCTAVLAEHDLTVEQARAMTTASGVALDWLIVSEAADADALAAQLADAVTATVDRPALLDRPRRRPQRAAAIWRAPQVTARDARTIEVETTDQPALLHRLCTAIAGAGHSLAAVRVSTLAHTVFDVFELQDPATDEQLEALRQALLQACRPPA